MVNEFSVLGKEVPVGEVDKELRMLWEADDASTKASLMNFAIYSEGQDKLLQNSLAVGEITREHSCRAILLELDRTCDDVEIRSWITAHCNLSGGKKAVCCEQIAFQINGYTEGIVRHTLFSHLESDLPLVVWWQGEFTPSYRDGFYTKVDRLIFDSASWSNPNEQFARLTDSMKKSRSLIVQDLSWTRTLQFRMAIAALIDHPVAMAHLSELTEVTICSNGGSRMSALQLMAWFTTMGEFKASPDLLATESDVHTYLKPEGGEVKFSSTYSDEYAALGAVEMHLGDCVLRITREADRQLLRQELIFNGDKVVDRHCPADTIADAALISDQLSRGGKNSLFRKVLPQFLELI